MSDSPGADWWCWTDDEPSTFRCRERGHDVRAERKAVAPNAKARAGHVCTHEEALAACTELSMALVAEALERQRAERERDEARAELASAARDGWIVARDGGRECERCTGEVARGQAYGLLPSGDLYHVHCPDREVP